MLRSLAFNTLFFVVFVVLGIAMLPTLLLPRRKMFAFVKAWGRINIWLMRHVAGIRLEFRGLDQVPEGPLLVAAKHQSTLETFALAAVLDDPTFVIKRELMWLPFFGWYSVKAGMIPVDRGAGVSAVRRIIERSRQEVARGRQIVIFPEGTRRAAGAPAAYKSGVGHMYAALDVPLVPVALNTGLFWPRRRFAKHPGTAVIEFLPPIPPGLPRAEAARLVEERIESATTALLGEAGAGRRAGPGINLSETITSARH
jgi:1-acyl-sn-glycerol-3-phosphate acyltransferase